jgi:proteic killer suppression protein
LGQFVNRNFTGYNYIVISSIRHKALKRLYEEGDARGIGANMRKRASEILSILDAIETIDEADIPGYRLHPLTGVRQGQWSMKVTGNWRITFRFVDGHVVDVDLEDYH